MTDEELAELCKTGDDTAFEELMRRYLKPIYAFTRQYTRLPEEAEDIAQDTFFKAWKYIKQFKSEKKFKPWLYTIARNTALDHIKKKKAVVFSALDDTENDLAFEDTLSDPEPLAPELFARAELAQELNEAMSVLHPDHRAVLIMHYHEDMTFEEIAETIDVPMNTVKSWHRRALVKVRKGLHQK